MAYRNMVRNQVRRDFMRDAERPGIMHDAIAMEEKKKRKQTKEKKNPIEPASKSPSETLLGVGLT